MRYVVGVDEVGLGAFAGPIFVCAFAAPESWTLGGLNDSKQLTAQARAALYRQLYLVPHALIRADAACIDRTGIRPCLVASHTLAIQEMLKQYPDAEIIVDGIVPLPAVPQARLIPKADAKYPVVMAASVLAKYNRDTELQQEEVRYPGYDFRNNVGYGTAKHRAALKALGMSPIHRRSYEPMKSM